MSTAPESYDSNEPANRFGPAQILAVVLGLLLLLILVWFFFLRGDGDDIDDTAAPTAPAPAASPAEDEDEDAGEALKRRPVETFEVFAPKDPFDPLISASAGAATGSTTTSGAGGTTTTTDGTTTTTDGTGTTTTDGTGTTTTTTTTSGSNGGGGGSSSVGGHRVRVIDVFREGSGNRAQIQVDGTVYTVDEGERFAQNFELLSTSGQCATMLYGDDEFTLCEGEEILK